MNLEIRRNVRLSATLAGAATLIAIAYLTRHDSMLDWLVIAMLAVIAGLNAAACWSARTPLFVADETGVRLRTGRTWRGLPWSDIRAVEVLRRHRWRDGAVDVLTEEDQEPISVRLALSTRIVGLDGHHTVEALVEGLSELAAGRAEVAEIDGYEYVDEDDWNEPTQLEVATLVPHLVPTVSEDLAAAPDRTRLVRPLLERTRTLLTARRDVDGPGEDDAFVAAEAAEPATTVASPTPDPARTPVSAVRAEATADRTEAITDLPDARELRRPGSVDLVEDTVMWSERPVAATPVAQVVDPVIGPRLAGARTRLGLSIDQLGERTRIRPHVIESIEADDFAPCGGDFYARGHLRTLARVLGMDAAPLIAEYDARYADAPIDPRRVFEAELGAGSIRSTRGGPNWSVLVAGVMAVVLAWSVVRLVTDSPVALDKPLPGFSPAGQTVPGGKVPVMLTASGGGARVVVRNADNEVVFQGPIAFGETKVLKAVLQPVRIQTSDGSLEVSLAGKAEGAMGRAGHPAQATYVSR